MLVKAGGETLVAGAASEPLSTSVLWIEDGASTIYEKGSKCVSTGLLPFICPHFYSSSAIQNWRIHWKPNYHPNQYFYGDHSRFLLLGNKPSFVQGAFFEESGETYKRIMIACLKPLEDALQMLLERSKLFGAPTACPLWSTQMQKESHKFVVKQQEPRCREVMTSSSRSHGGRRVVRRRGKNKEGAIRWVPPIALTLFSPKEFAVTAALLMEFLVAGPYG